MGRMYTASANAAVTTAVDLFELNAPSDAIVVLHEVVITNSSDTDSEQLRVTMQRAGASGSGGSAGTVTPHEVGSPAFGGTVEFHNTTPAGTLTPLRDEAFNVLNGYQYIPTPETRIVLSPSARLVLHLETVPADSINLSVSLTFEEIGG